MLGTPPSINFEDTPAAPGPPLYVWSIRIESLGEDSIAPVTDSASAAAAAAFPAVASRAQANLIPPAGAAWCGPSVERRRATEHPQQKG